jgi:hypothetical protein
VAEEDLGPALPGLRLTSTEAAVFRALSERERERPNPRLARTYLRLLELSRSEDPVDAILVAHLVREVLSALPGALGIEVTRGRLEYENRVQAMSEGWPADVRTGEPAQATIQALRRLLEDHDAASERARHGPRALLDREDRARAGFVPASSVDRWVALSVRSTGFAHRVRAAERELPSADDGRRVADELTATMLAAIAPYLVGIGELDRLLETQAPAEHEANAAVALLRTPSQYAYFFDRADQRWLQPLAAIPRLLTSPPGLIDMGDGYVQTPDWPQGRYLARVAAGDPALMLRLIEQIPQSTNPRVVARVVGVARALPVEAAAQLVPTISNRITVPLGVDYAALDASRLAQELAEGGQPEAGSRLLASVVRATISAQRDMDWHLEQVLAEPLDAIATAGGDMGHPLASRVRRLVGSMGPSRRYTTLWLRNIDRRPTYGVDKRWIVPNALYRHLLAAPLVAARDLTTELLADRLPVLTRIAIAACADRPDLVVDSDPLLLDPERWDKEGTTRFEFRRSLGSLWAMASQPARDALLAYAERAAEVQGIRERLAASGREYAEGELERLWRSRLLHRVREQVPTEWLERAGPLDPVEDERMPEPSAGWIRSESPVEATELSELAPEAFLELLRGWVPPEEPTFQGPTLQGLATAAGEVVVSRLPEFEATGAEIAGLRPPLVQAITSQIERALREDRIDERQTAVRLVLSIAEAYDPDTADDEWSQQARRDFAGTISVAANKEILNDADIARALAILDRLLTDHDPSPAAESRDAENGYDVGMLALNSVRGEATAAAIELLLECQRMGKTDLVEATGAALRTHVATDDSRSVRAALGIRLPWLLLNDVPHQAEWIELLFGPGVSPEAKRATWHAYLSYSRFFVNTATLLARQYTESVTRLEPRPEDSRRGPRDEDEQLGIHAAFAHLLGLPAEAAGDWLGAFYERAPGWLRSRVTRWIAEQAAVDEATPEVRARSRSFLLQRVAIADAAADVEDLKAVGWIAAATERGDEVLAIVLPALEKTGGATDNEVGMASLAARMATGSPRPSARVLQLLVDGDPWRSLPHVAAAELRTALEVLVASADEDAKVIAQDIVNTLGAQGFLEFRDLLDVATPTKMPRPAL